MNITKLKSYTCAIIAAGATSIVSCNSSGNESSSADYSIDGKTITVTENSPLNERIEVSKITAGSYSPSFTSPGEVRALPSKYAEVAVPFSGRIAASLVSPGTKVNAGTPLFKISSSEFMDVCRNAFDTRTEKEQAARNLARVKRMYESKMASAAEYEEAQADYEIKARAADNAVASLKIFGADIQSITPGEPMTVKAPIAGSVVSNSLVTGQYVKDDDEASIVIADLAKVWIVANVKEADFVNLKNIDNVEISIPSVPDTIFTGKLIHINEILDPATRTVDVTIECDNAGLQMKPNMFGTVTMTSASENALLIPTSAIRRKEDITYVMRSLGERKYEGVIITTGNTSGDLTVVKSGLNSGDEIVTKGSFYLPEPNL